jgi:hypothetical protein
MSDHSWVYHLLKNAHRFAFDQDPTVVDETIEEALPPPEASALVARAEIGQCHSTPRDT